MRTACFAPPTLQVVVQESGCADFLKNRLAQKGQRFLVASAARIGCILQESRRNEYSSEGSFYESKET